MIELTERAIPLTVNTTPRLGLMSPVDSDTFQASDYATTFGKLDAQPGIKIVSSYSALTSYSGGFSTPTAHHGEVALDTSTNAQWWWNCPSGSGAWVRCNSVGLLAQASQSSDVSSSATTGNGSNVVSTGNFTAPGKRPLRVDVYVAADNTNTNNLGLVWFNILDSGSNIVSYVIRTGPGYTGYGTRGTDNFLTYFITNPSVNSTHNIALYVRSASGGGTYGSGGTSTARSATLTITEA